MTGAVWRGHREAYNLVRTLDADEKVLVKGSSGLRTPDDQGVWFLTEPGFYKAVGDAHLMRAVPLTQVWVVPVRPAASWMPRRLRFARSVVGARAARLSGGAA